MSRVRCLLRTARMKSGLCQKDLAALLPRAGHNRVSRVERGLDLPNAAEILAYQLIFDTLPKELFPGLVRDVEVTVLHNARRLRASLAKDESEQGRRTKAFVRAILARAAHRARHGRV